MYKRNYIILFLILIALCVISIQHVYTHTWGWRAFIDHDNSSGFLKATKTKITCNIKNYQIFSKKDIYYSDGYFHSSSGWNPSLKNPAKISISGKAHGIGFAQIVFHGNVDDKDFGDEKDLSPKIDIGSTLVFFSNDAHDADVSMSKSVKYTPSNGKHKWEGSGTIYYTPIYFKMRFGLPWIASGTWENGVTWSSSNSGDGSWEIIDKDATINYPKYPSTSSSSSGGSSNGDGSEDTNSGQVTAPDRPGRFTLTPYKIAILLKWEPSASDGGSPIERYEYQYQSSNYNRKAWSDWSEWTSAGKGKSTWITGLNPGVDYGVRMCAYNGEEYSIKTGIVIVKTKK